MAQHADDRASETPPPPQRGPSPTPPQRPWYALSRRSIVFFLALLALNVFVTSRAMGPESRVRVPYSPFFLQQVNAGNVEEITSKGTDLQGTFGKEVTFEDSDPTTRFRTEIPAFANTDELAQVLQQNDVVVNAEPLDTGAPWWQTLLFSFAPVILLVALFVFLTRRAGNVRNALGSFGQSRARRYVATGDKVTFADVAGIEEAKDELTEVVDFLRNPDKYRKLGARIPHGVLLSGLPGTGKTLLARAVAGEADVPFFSIAASEFVETFVGVGAARVRDLFKEAKENAPAIVFIDELDAIGRSRTSGVAGFSGGNDEREQTLNQILTEMDGFDSAANVIVLAATNRPDVLDQALLRPGRFDRRVAVQPPDRDRARSDPSGARPRHPARPRRRPRTHRRDDAGNGRSRPRQPGERGGADRRPARARRGRGSRRHRRARADRPRRGAPGDDERRGSSADGLPRGWARDRRDADARGGSRAKGLDHPARDGAGSDVLRARRRSLQLPGAGDHSRRSRGRSAVASRRSSSSARSARAPSRTSSS